MLRNSVDLRNNINMTPTMCFIISVKEESKRILRKIIIINQPTWANNVVFFIIK